MPTYRASFRSFLAIVAALVAITCAPLAAAPPTAAPPAASETRSVAAAPAPAVAGSARSLGPAGPGAELYALPNGLRVVLLETHGNPMVASTVLVRAGGRYETERTSGASHFLEHLLFDGTTSRSQAEIARAADLIGAYNNATTRDEYTLFQFLAHRDFLDTALDIQSDMLFRSIIDEASFAKERKVVLEELARDASEPGYEAELVFRRAFFGTDARSRPTLGTKASIEAMTRDDVRAYYRAAYRPDRMVLFLAGDFERAAALARIEARFGAPIAPETRAAPELREPAAQVPKAGVYRKHLTGERGYLTVGLPAPGSGHEDETALRALAGLLGSGPGSRLAGALAGGPSQLVLDASATYVPGRGAGVFEIAATIPADSDGVQALRAIRTELARLAQEPVSAEELRAIVGEERANIVYLRDQVHYLGMQSAPELVLSDRPSVGGGAQALAVLTPELVRAAASKWLAGPLVAMIAAPKVPEGTDPTKAEPLPAELAPAAMGQGSVPLASLKSSPAGAPRPVRRIDFENGVVLLIAENPDSDVFAAHVLVRDRASHEPAGKEGMADLLHRLLPYGSLFLDGEGVRQKLKLLGARLKTVDDPEIPYDDYYTSPRYSYARLETVRENWREAFGLLYAILEYPRLELRDFALAASEEIDLARKTRETPNSLARQLYAQTLLGDSPLAHPVTGTAISIATIKPDDLRAFQRRYLSPDQLIISVVSSVSASEVAEAVRSSFGALAQAPGAPELTPLKPGEERRRLSVMNDPPLTLQAQKVEVKSGKEQSQILVGGIFARDRADLAPLIVATTILSATLTQDLRETRGLAYSVGCSLEDFGGKSWFTAQMGTRPEGVDEAEAALRSAIGAFADADPPPEELTRAVNAMRGQMAMRRMTRISQAYAIGFNEFLGRSPDFDRELDAALGAVTAADVRRVARRYLNPAQMVSALAR